MDLIGAALSNKLLVVVALGVLAYIFADRIKSLIVRYALPLGGVIIGGIVLYNFLDGNDLALGPGGAIFLSIVLSASVVGLIIALGSRSGN
jgi:hypothetical protein